MRIRTKIFAIECKSNYSPTLSKGNYNALEDIAPNHSFIVSPIEKGWQMKKDIDVVSIDELEDKIKE